MRGDVAQPGEQQQQEEEEEEVGGGEGGESVSVVIKNCGVIGSKRIH